MQRNHTRSSCSVRDIVNRSTIFWEISLIRWWMRAIMWWVVFSVERRSNHKRRQVWIIFSPWNIDTQTTLIPIINPHLRDATHNSNKIYVQPNEEVKKVSEIFIINQSLYLSSLNTWTSRRRISSITTISTWLLPFQYDFDDVFHDSSCVHYSLAALFF